MVFSVAARVVRRRSSAVKLSAAMEEFGEIPIILGFDPLGRRNMHNHNLNHAPVDAGGLESNVDIGDYPMAILTRGATAEDPVIQVAPHVHVIHAAGKGKGSWAGLGAGAGAASSRISASAAVSFSKWALSVPQSLSLAISQSNTTATATSPCPSPHASDGETTPKASDFAEAAKLKLDASCSSSATMALARRAHVRLPSASLTRRAEASSQRDSRAEVMDEDEGDHRRHEEENRSATASTSFLPLRPATRPLRIRRKRFSSASVASNSEEPEESGSDFDHALPLQPTSVDNVPSGGSPPSRHDSVILPVASLLMNHPTTSSYYDARHPAHDRWSSSSFDAAATPIDWSVLESTLGCSTLIAETAQPKPRERFGRSPKSKTSPTRAPEKKSFTDRPLPPLPSTTTTTATASSIPEIVVHEPASSASAKKKRRGAMIGGPSVGGRKSIEGSGSELLPGCSGIDFD